jgi:Holliday junction resolvasome RuvABC ATP-dependent DNA helicase subunit
MMTRKFGGGPVGLDTLSTAIGEERGTLEEWFLTKKQHFCERHRIAVFI